MSFVAWFLNSLLFIFHKSSCLHLLTKYLRCQKPWHASSTRNFLREPFRPMTCTKIVLIFGASVPCQTCWVIILEIHSSNLLSKEKNCLWWDFFFCFGMFFLCLEGLLVNVRFRDHGFANEYCTYYSHDTLFPKI